MSKSILNKPSSEAASAKPQSQGARGATHAQPGGYASSSLPFFPMQQTLGNQAMLQLLESGTIQPKLSVSQPGADELEAAQVAERVVAPAHGPILQRKCSCGGTCSGCSQEKDDLIQRKLKFPFLHSRNLRLQRTAAGESAEVSGAKDSPPATHSLIVEDEAPKLEPGQMKKSEFMAQLRSTVCSTADRALAAAGRSSKSCPYIESWLAFYADQSSTHLEKALRKYAPEAAGATRAQQYLSIISGRVQKAVTIWAKTGKITGVPAGLPLMPAAGGSSEGGGAHQQEGAKQTAETASHLQTKTRDSREAAPKTADIVRQRLGSGEALNGNVRSRMESAFGQDFSDVRLHTNPNAGQLSSELNARAFTIGSDVAFASGEYKPGTLIGDALIAHELAHVVQQKSADKSSAPLMNAGSDYDVLEADADLSAVGAVASLWTGAKGQLAEIGKNAGPQLKSGLKLQRCGKTSNDKPGAAHYYDEPSGLVEEGLHGIGLRPTKKERAQEARQFFKATPGLRIDGEEVDADELSDDEVMEKFRQYKEACSQMTMGGQVPCERVMPHAAAAGVMPTPPPTWSGSFNDFGKEIGWPAQGKIKTPAEAADLAKLRRAGVTEKWATEQAKVYREVAKANPKNPSALIRAEWLEKIAERLRNEP